MATQAEGALPAALAISDQIGAQGAALAAASGDAFVDGLQLAMVIAAASVAAIAASSSGVHRARRPPR